MRCYYVIQFVCVWRVYLHRYKCFYERFIGAVIFWGFPGWFRFDIRNTWRRIIVFVTFILPFQFKKTFQFYFPFKVFYVGFNLFFVIKSTFLFNTLDCFFFVNECFEIFITFASGSSLYQAALEINFRKLTMFP